MVEALAKEAEIDSEVDLVTSEGVVFASRLRTVATSARTRASGERYGWQQLGHQVCGAVAATSTTHVPESLNRRCRPMHLYSAAA